MLGQIIGGVSFLTANTSLEEEKYVNHRIDCNTVGPVHMASGFGSRTLTHSAVHMLDSSKDHASASSSLYGTIHTQFINSDFKELSKTKVEDPKRSSEIDPLVGRLDAQPTGTKATCFTVLMAGI